MATALRAARAARRREMYEGRLARAVSLRDRGNVVIGWLLAEAYRSADPTGALGRLEALARQMNERNAQGRAEP